jgi:hypothetical protein
VQAELLLFPSTPCFDVSCIGELMELGRKGEAWWLTGGSMSDDDSHENQLSSSSTLVGDAAGRPCFPTLHTSSTCIILLASLAPPLLKVSTYLHT